MPKLAKMYYELTKKQGKKMQVQDFLDSVGLSTIKYKRFYEEVDKIMEKEKQRGITHGLA